MTDIYVRAYEITWHDPRSVRRPEAANGTGRNHFNGADFRHQQAPRSKNQHCAVPSDEESSRVDATRLAASIQIVDFVHQFSRWCNVIQRSRYIRIRALHTSPASFQRRVTFLDTHFRCGGMAQYGATSIKRMFDSILSQNIARTKMQAGANEIRNSWNYTMRYAVVGSAHYYFPNLLFNNSKGSAKSEEGREREREREKRCQFCPFRVMIVKHWISRVKLQFNVGFPTHQRAEDSTSAVLVRKWENLERRETTRACTRGRSRRGLRRIRIHRLSRISPPPHLGTRADRRIAIGDYVNQTRAVYAPAICPGIIFP